MICRINKLGHLAAMLVMLFCGIGYGQEAFMVKILSVEGQVEVTRSVSGAAAMQPIAFKTEDTLKTGDRIVTGKNGRLVLGLSDGSQAVIAPKTTVLIDDLSQSPRTLFNIIKGKTRIHIEKLGGRPNPYKVNTPTAVIAVRGTIFDVMVGESDTEVFLVEGEVAVINRRLPDRPTILRAGEMTRVRFEGPPRNPSAFKPDRNDNTFRPKEAVRPDDATGRIANGPGARPDTVQKRPDASIGARPDFGRTGTATPPTANRPTVKPVARPGGRP